MLQKPAEREDAGQSQGAEEERPEGDGHALAQAAGLVDVQVAVLARAVHHRAGAQEEQGLEEGVRHQVEDADATPPTPRPIIM